MSRFHTDRRSAAILAFTLLLSGCVTSTQATRLQKDLDEVKRQLFQVQQDSAGSRSQMDELARGLAKQGSASTAQADLSASIESLLDQIQGLSEKTKELTSQVMTLTQEIQSMKESTRRNGGAPGTSVSAPSSSAFPADSPPAPSSSPADQSFRIAYADYSKGNYELALMGFTEFLRSFSSDLRAADAKYWVGECLYSQGKYKEAIEAFDIVLTSHPGADKGPAALLKKGYSQIELGQTSLGVETLSKLISAHSDSEEARLASERLRQLGLRN